MSAVITRMLKKIKEEFDSIGSNQIDRYQGHLLTRRSVFISAI